MEAATGATVDDGERANKLPDQQSRGGAERCRPFLSSVIKSHCGFNLI